MCSSTSPLAACCARRPSFRAAVAALLLALVAGPSLALDGKWMPEQVLALDARWLRSQGLELKPEQLWGADGAGLLAATVAIDGCTAAFVSASGLLVTNHHCALTAIQQHSTPERDLLQHGFLAATPGEELPLLGNRATVPASSRDVTTEVLGAVPAGADDLARQRAIEQKSKALVAACEATPNRRCRVAAYDGGVRYVLDEGIEYPDLRLVWAPPYEVGNFGGEIDNWSWPRHTGDFTLLRVWAAADGSPAARAEANVPLRPKQFYPLGADGVDDGDFVMITGYPGTTYRSLTVAEMEERVELFFPRRAELYRAWIDRFETFTRRDEATRIALAARLRTLANREKNARGQLAGIARGGHLEQRRFHQQTVAAWIEGKPGPVSPDANPRPVARTHGAHGGTLVQAHPPRIPVVRPPRPEFAPALAALTELERLANEHRASWERDFLLDEAKVAAKPLELALTVVRWAVEQAKPDLERQSGFQQRDRTKLAERLERDQTQIAVEADAAVLADWFLRMHRLPAELRSAAVSQVVAAIPAFAPGDAAAESAAREALETYLAGIFRQSPVLDPKARLAMLDETPQRLAARRDPFLDLALALDRELVALRDRQDAWKGTVSRLRPEWRRAVQAHAGKPIAPDANSSLRVSFGHVQGYEPREAVWMRSRTTLDGLLAKITGEAPFSYPERLVAAAREPATSPWVVPELGTVPVAFLADLDTTGGNSGSPVLDGKGRLVGVNFDRVWENIANDFGFDPKVARNVAVDVRYLLWVLTAVHGEAAEALLAELGVAAVPVEPLDVEAAAAEP
jgi:hypothetical protein